ncbi:uncharacterized protein LOC121357700 [Pyrgilauda ruficollis]|uniref:uncharacterized protein LOC121357700 n=1 Tax=Pyrgilauda ruficollis TaxID=221976 RepID=UPI001B87F136|nr:uncharacterized protein LOC121357700 [Pyrgilauda ruficollis]
MLELPFLLQPVKCKANNETIPLPFPQITVCLQEPRSAAVLFPVLLPQERGWAEKRLALPWALSALTKSPHHGAVDSQKDRHRAQRHTTPGAEPSWKRPCSPISCARTKRFPQSAPSKSTPFFTPHSKSSTNCFALTKLFALTESGHNLENIWQKQSSLRKLLAEKALAAYNFKCAHRFTRSHPAISTFLLSSRYHSMPSVSQSQDPNRMAPGTAHILKVPGQKAQQKHLGLMAHFSSSRGQSPGLSWEGFP